MGQDLTLKGIILEKLNRVLNPNFDSKFIWTLLTSGIFLVGYQRVIELCSSLEIVSGTTYVKLALNSRLDIALIVIGCLMIASSIFIFVRKQVNSNQIALKRYKSLAKSAKEIRPLIDDNRRIFTAFGPNSKSGNTDDLRQDYEVWEHLKREQVVPNNDKILSILNCVATYSQEELLIVNKMKSHITAFNKHCADPNFDYTNNQFPLGFADLIFSYSRKGSNKIDHYSKWLQKNLTGSLDNIEAVYIFGSALYGQETTDVDVIIKNNLDSIDEVRRFSETSKEIRDSFEIEFSIALHLQVFSNLETKSFSEFLKKIHKSEKVI